MHYSSTRGQAPILTFEDVVLGGLAPDGGLYLPETWPELSADRMRALARLTYAELAAHLLSLFAEPDVPEAELALLADHAYMGFTGYPEPAPLRPIGDDMHLLELFHGPTLAFKDYALQILGRLFDLVLARRGERVTIIGATSGDTGSAAIEACRDRSSLDIFMLHPRGRVSDVQRRQMTTVTAPNIHNIAVEGTFDDCQALVKALFNDAPFRDRFRLAAVNSINWARIAAQIVYYVHAALALGAPEREVTFVVPTGNFGNVFAAWAARRMGVPIRRLVVASNRNDILARFFADGRMQVETVVPTLSPSMDIQVSSNFERYLFELHGRDADAVRERMRRFQAEGAFTVGSDRFREASGTFLAGRCDDDATQETIRALHARHGILIDPHTAVGVAVARALSSRLDPGVPVVCVATAHPAKFPDAVFAATGVRPELPGRLADLLERPEYCRPLENDAGALRSVISRTMHDRGVAP